VRELVIGIPSVSLRSDVEEFQLTIALIGLHHLGIIVGLSPRLFRRGSVAFGMRKPASQHFEPKIRWEQVGRFDEKKMGNLAAWDGSQNLDCDGKAHGLRIEAWACAIRECRGGFKEVAKEFRASGSSASLGRTDVW
jgi:hypothetical protein